MKIVVAMDSFKDSLTAVQACDIVAKAVRSALPDAHVVCKPMADGGEGTAHAMVAAAGGRWIERTVTGPLPQMRVEAGFAWLAPERTAVVEMATASGLELLSPGQRNPLRTTTFGTGQLVEAAVTHGASRILLAVGGSATVDGGVGAAAALGWKFLDKNGQQVGLGGGCLSQIERIAPPERAIHVPVEVLCDVDNPLCGPHGAANVYGPQKGATPDMVEKLDAGLAHLAQLVRELLGRDIKDLPGAGAAGGVSAGAVVFMNARLVCGIDAVMSCSRLRQEVADADWVITGEGRFDHQSLRGKVISGVTRIAKQGDAKVAVLAGQVLLSPRAYHDVGIDVATACMNSSIDLQYALANSGALLSQAADRLARKHLLG